MNTFSFQVYNDFLPKKDFLKILKDIDFIFKNDLKFIHKDKLKSGVQTKPNLHLKNQKPHWKNFFNLLLGKIPNKKIGRCWGLKIDKKQKNFFHTHGNLITSVFYIQNKDYYLGTHLKQDNNEIILPGYENSLLIFNGNIFHDAVFPNYKLKKPRYTLITDLI
jgi:hypothetical protein